MIFFTSVEMVYQGKVNSTRTVCYSLLPKGQAELWMQLDVKQ